jgi:FkbM family methyltransferase
MLNTEITREIELESCEDIFRDHRVFDKGLFPAAGIIDLILAEINRHIGGYEVQQLEISHITWVNPIQHGDHIRFNAIQEGNGYQLRINKLNSPDDKLCCSAQISVGKHPLRRNSFPHQNSFDSEINCTESLSESRLYSLFSKNCIDYRGRFISVKSLEVSEKQAIGHVSLALPEGEYNRTTYLVDAAIQCAMGHSLYFGSQDKPKVPVSIESFRIHRQFSVNYTVKVILQDLLEPDISSNYDLLIESEQNELIAEISGLCIRNFNNLAPSEVNIGVSSSFTVLPLKDHLQSQLQAEMRMVKIDIAQDNQIIRHLLFPQSPLQKLNNDFNALLIRLEDFYLFNQSELDETVKLAAAEASTDDRKNHKCYTLPNNMYIAHLNDYETAYLYEEIFLNKVYEKNGISIKDGDVVLDVGANIGMFALSIVSRYPSATVYSFEPSTQAYEVLKCNADLYGGSQIIACEYGIADQEDERLFTYYPNSSVFSGYHAQRELDENALRTSIANSIRARNITRSESEIERLADSLLHNRLDKVESYSRVRTLSNVIESYGIEKIDLLKIDAEKSEWEVLNGLSAGDWEKIRQLVLEIHDVSGETDRKIIELLSNKGFDVVQDEEVLLDGSGLRNVYARKREILGDSYEIDRFGDEVRCQLRDNLKELVTALKQFSDSNSSESLLLICPPSPKAIQEFGESTLEKLTDEISQSLVNCSNIRALVCSDHDDSPSGQYYDSTRDLLGDIPYTQYYYGVMASILSKGVTAVSKN